MKHSKWIRQVALASVALCATMAFAHDEHAHWAYKGHGSPNHWGELDTSFETCARGGTQSPIDIRNPVKADLPALSFQYAAGAPVLVNNGHTVQVNVPAGSTLTVGDQALELVQFHFHTPAEEQINGKRAAMVAHLVHRNDEGQLAVVAVLLEPGAANPMIDKVWTYMPLDVKDQVRMPAGLLNLNELLPADQRYYQFMGSLTTPPCSEGVLWMVLKSPMSISAAQLKLFTQLYPMNARPVQAVNGRPVRSAQ